MVQLLVQHQLLVRMYEICLEDLAAALLSLLYSLIADTFTFSSSSQSLAFTRSSLVPENV